VPNFKVTPTFFKNGDNKNSRPDLDLSRQKNAVNGYLESNRAYHLLQLQQDIDKLCTIQAKVFILKKLVVEAHRQNIHITRQYVQIIIDDIDVILHQTLPEHKDARILNIKQQISELHLFSRKNSSTPERPR
jgi:hypothetical protein